MVSTVGNDSRDFVTWRWTAHINGKPHRGESEKWGVVLETSPSAAMDLVARELSCSHRAHQYHCWLSGGWGRYTNDYSDSVTVLIVTGEEGTHQ
jgi:hypothetical protein